MRTEEAIKKTLEYHKQMQSKYEGLMESALESRSEFAYNVHKEDFKKAGHYIEILEYVLGDRD